MQKPPQQSDAALIVLPEPRAIADFALIDDEGTAILAGNLRGQWSLLFFGFTHCPDVCPSTLYDLKLIHEKVGAGPAAMPATRCCSFRSTRNGTRPRS